ncbi:unnamed protein product [Macrosiphum euphorbiae]|nr:unnamed protein product [Macrosiphum euphorbiae]
MSTKGHSVRQLQNIFNCGKTQVYDTLKNQNRIKEEWLNGNGKMIKAMKHNDNEIINNEIWEFRNFSVLLNKAENCLKRNFLLVPCDSALDSFHCTLKTGFSDCVNRKLDSTNHTYLSTVVT